MQEKHSKINWSALTDKEKNELVAEHIALNTDDTIYHLDNIRYCFDLLCEKLPRGFRWRPDNGLLQCYGDYNEPCKQVDCETFEDGAWFILLKLAGLNIQQ